MLRPEHLIDAYSRGLFPMAENRLDENLFWIDPEMRGILPLNAFHVSRSLKKKIRNNPYNLQFDHDFDAVIRACAQHQPNRQKTWINDQIIDLYTQLFVLGYAHSVECWRGTELVGGLYGISIKGAFFGESMFSLERDTSKIALVHLVARLKFGKFILLDTQFVTGHLKQFGAVEIPRSEYHKLLKEALISSNAKFHSEVPLGTEGETLSGILQSRTQTS